MLRVAHTLACIATLTAVGHASPTRPEEPVISFQTRSVPERPTNVPQSAIIFPQPDGSGNLDTRFRERTLSRGGLPSFPPRRGRLRRVSSRIYFPGEEVPTLAPNVVEDTTKTRTNPTDFTTEDQDASLPFIVDEPPPRNKHGGGDSDQSDASLPFIEDTPPRRDNPQDVIDVQVNTSQSPALPTPTPSTHSAIHFDIDLSRPRPSTVAECDGVPYFAYNNQTGDCQELWTTKNCPNGYWFVLSHRTHEATCLPRSCPKESVWFKGECLEGPDASALCPPGMTIFVNEYGQGFCDCTAKHAYWARHGRCYPVYYRGPCDVGQYLIVPEGSNAAVCVRNECPDGEVRWTEQRTSMTDPIDDTDRSAGGLTGNNSADELQAAADTCFPLEDADDTPCMPGRLEVDSFTLQLVCKRIMLQAIFNPPKVRCAPGSYLDYNGNCREALFQKFRTRFLVNLDSRKGTEDTGSVCPPGFKMAPDRRCVNTALSGGGLG